MSDYDIAWRRVSVHLCGHNYQGDNDCKWEDCRLRVAIGDFTNYANSGRRADLEFVARCREFLTWFVEPTAIGYKIFMEHGHLLCKHNEYRSEIYDLLSEIISAITGKPFVRISNRWGKHHSVDGQSTIASIYCKVYKATGFAGFDTILNNKHGIKWNPRNTLDDVSAFLKLFELAIEKLEKFLESLDDFLERAAKRKYRGIPAESSTSSRMIGPIPPPPAIPAPAIPAPADSMSVSVSIDDTPETRTPCMDSTQGFIMINGIKLNIVKRMTPTHFTLDESASGPITGEIALDNGVKIQVAQIIGGKLALLF